MAATTTPIPVRFAEVDTRLSCASERSGVGKSDIVRMAVAAFLEQHTTADQIIAAAIRYRTRIARQEASA